MFFAMANYFKRHRTFVAGTLTDIYTALCIAGKKHQETP